MKIAKRPKSKLVTNGQNRRITPSDAEQIAELCATGLNESEACAIIGIPRREQWFNWKSIHKSEYEDIFTRIKASRIKNLVGQIDKAANGSDGIRHDWRAADRLLAIADPRFRETKEPTPATPAIALDVLSSLASLVYGQGKPTVDAEVIAPRKEIAGEGGQSAGDVRGDEGDGHAQA